VSQPARREPIPVRPAADRALALAIQAWGGTPGPSFWQHLPGRWSESLQDVLSEEPPRSASEAEAALRRALTAQARADPGSVHSSWWVRALRDESPSIQRAVAAHADPALRTILLTALSPGSTATRPIREPDPDALRWVLALWDERILRDLPEWPDDPPIIRALCQLDFREVVALARAAGLAKLALAEPDAPPRRAQARERFADFQRQWLASGLPDLTEARRSSPAFLQGWTGPRGWGRLGLVTFGRLLARVEPYRARWALQHLPYSAARRIRPAIKELGTQHAAWESAILRVAWERLAAAGEIRSVECLTREYRCL
jgi:hypothetical protein